MAMIDANGIRDFLSKERRVRKRHALGLEEQDLLSLYSEDTGIIGLSSTQDVPVPNLPRFRLSFPDTEEISYSQWHQTTYSTYRDYLSWCSAIPERGYLFSENRPCFQL